MSATGAVTQGVFWGHVVAAVVLTIGGWVVSRLVAELDFAPAGIESAPWARTSLERGVPAGIVVFAVAVLANGFAYLSAKVTDLDPATSALGTVERVAITVPGGLVGRWAGLAGLALFNGAIVLFLVDLGYRYLLGD